MLNKSIAIAWVLVVMSMVSAQLSPGDLHHSHAFLEGVENCTKCHEAGRGISAGKCLDCHQLLKDRIDAGKGLHARSEYRECQHCHVEHQGRDFELIWWPKGQEQFDHSLTGYKLEGKHTRLECRQCHRPEHIAQRKLFEIAKKDLKRTFLGLNSDCLSCHRDEHRGQLGSDCRKCHEMTGWTPASRFNHQQTNFPLKGKHNKIACTKCHQLLRDDNTPDDPTYLKFAGILHQSCTNCHRDVHAGRFGTSCQKCHNENGWKKVDERGFNHNLTNFPLRGKHASLPCQSCHAPDKPGRKVPHEKCRDCHEDRHRGQIRFVNEGGDCAACHTVEGFSPARFSVDDHQKLRFPLQGAHLAVPCNGCHTSRSLGSEKVVRFRFESTRCQDCHRNAHGGDVQRFLGKQGCESCHRVSDWAEVNFNHDETEFPLVGKHAGLQCTQCHRPEGQDKNRQIRFKNTSQRCMDCHQDIHLGQFADAGGLVNCARCHTPAGWEIKNYDHNRLTRFPLEGAHSRLTCDRCHVEEQQNGQRFVRYRPLGRECRDCHGKSGSENQFQLREMKNS